LQPGTDLPLFFLKMAEPDISPEETVHPHQIFRPCCVSTMLFRVAEMGLYPKFSIVKTL
jgi:hypothetical protein